MPTPQALKQWYEFSLIQVVAESYLDIDLANLDTVVAALQNGNNHRDHEPQNGKGGTRLATYQAEQLLGVQINRTTRSHNWGQV